MQLGGWGGGHLSFNIVFHHQIYNTFFHIFTLLKEGRVLKLVVSQIADCQGMVVM